MFIIKRTLKSIRLDLKLQQKEMAEMLGIALSAYQKKERGESPLLARELSLISIMSNIPMDNIEIPK